MPRLPRIGPGEVVPIRRVAPNDIGSGVGDVAYGRAADTLAQASASIQAAEQQGNVASALAATSAKFAELEQSEAQNPDHNGREGRFDEARTKIVGEFRKTIRGGAFQADYDTRAAQLGDRTRFAVRQGVIARRLDIAKGGALEAAASFDAQAEAATDPSMAEALRMEGSRALDAAEASGAMSASERAQHQITRDSGLRQFKERQALGKLREAIRVDPAATYRALSDPAQFPELDEYQRQVGKDQAITAHEQNLAAGRAEYTFNQQQQERADKLLRADTVKQLDDLLAQHKMDDFQQGLEQARDVLTPEQYRFYLNRQAAGGGLENPGAQLNPDVYSSLWQEGIVEGKPIAEKADAAFRAGEIPQARRDDLIKQNEERRFGSAERYVRDALQVGALIDNPTGRQHMADAQVSMTKWRLRNPDASDEEAMDYAQDLVKRNMIFDVQSISAMLTAPPVPDNVGNRNDGYDITAGQAAINDKYIAKHMGDVTAAMSDPGYLDDMKSLEQWNQLQNSPAWAAAHKAPNGRP